MIAVAAAVAYFAPQLSAALVQAGLTASQAAAVIAIGTAVVTIGASMALNAIFPGPKAAGPGPQTFRQSIANSFIVYGKRRVGGLLCFFHPAGKNYRYFVIAVAGHRCKGVTRWYLNNEIVTVNGDGLVTSGTYANNAWLWFMRGTDDQVAHSTFVAETSGKWTANHRGRGVALIYAKFKMADAVVQAGMPNITAEVEGKDDILDPRTGDRGYTKNAALVFYDWMLLARAEGGFGAYEDEVDWDWVSAQANVCDELVPVGYVHTALSVAAAVDAGSITISDASGLAAGMSITIGASGSYQETKTVQSVSGLTVTLTSDLANAYPVPTPVTWAPATGAVTEPRYEFDSYITTGAAPSEVRDSFVVCCAGSYTYAGGRHLMRPGYYVPPSNTLTEQDLAGPIQLSALLAGDAISSAVAGTFVDPDALYQAGDVPTRSIVSPDDTQTTVDLAHITSSSRGQRICEIMLRRMQAERRLTWPMNIMGIAISTLDTVQCATARYGLSNYAFQVTGWQLGQDFSVQLVLEEHNSDIFYWDATMELDTESSGVLTAVDPSLPPDDPTPGAWALSGGVIGTSSPALTLTRISSVADESLDDADELVAEIRIHVAGQADDAGWTNATLFDPMTAEIQIASVAAHTSYDAAVSYRSAAQTSGRLILGPATTGGATTTPPAPTVAAANGTGSNVVTVRAPQSAFDHIDLLRGATNDATAMTVIDADLIIGLGATYSDTYATTAGTWWYSAIAYAADGTPSAPATPVSAVIS